MAKNKVQPRGWRKMFPRESDPEADRLNDEALRPGVSVNNEPAKLQEGDLQTVVLRFVCSCRAGIGAASHVDRRHRGLEDLWFVAAQLVEEATARPPKVGTYRRALSTEETYPMECPIHGRHEVPGDRIASELLGHETANRLRTDRTAVMHVQRWRVS